MRREGLYERRKLSHAWVVGPTSPSQHILTSVWASVEVRSKLRRNWTLKFQMGTKKWLGSNPNFGPKFKGQFGPLAFSFIKAQAHTLEAHVRLYHYGPIKIGLCFYTWKYYFYALLLWGIDMLDGSWYPLLILRPRLKILGRETRHWIRVWEE